MVRGSSSDASIRQEGDHGDNLLSRFWSNICSAAEVHTAATNSYFSSGKSFLDERRSSSNRRAELPPPLDCCDLNNSSDDVTVVG